VNLPEPPLLLITDRKQAAHPLIDIIASALDGGCRWIMLREKDLPADERIALLSALLEIATPYNAFILVNDDLAAAATTGAAGIHLPQNSHSPAKARAQLGPDAVIGVSAHNLDEANAAANSGADYVTLSPVFISPSKPDYGPALTPSGFGAIATQLPIPVLALGGIEHANTKEVMEDGAHGIAIMGSIMRSADPTSDIRCFVDLIVE
jgi:thiamine-phosphate pyrophosphorylase